MTLKSERTLGEFVEQEGLLDSLREAIAQINAQATSEAKQLSKLEQLPPVQCFKCTARKACCLSVVVARFYEGVVVAAHLVQTERDTAELREQLRTAAAAMEAANPYEWRVPCVFLDATERCTVYAARPTACGTLYVYSPPANCNTPGAPVRAYLAHAENATATMLEDKFRERLAVRKRVGRRYLGVLPRMVLLALELWDRSDYRDALRAYAWPTDADVERWNRR
jgi:Fe-S-cluster containining protein